MINKYVSALAAQIGMKFPKVSLVDGLPLGCRDTFLLNISTKERLVSAIIYRTELESLEKGLCCDRLELRIRSALSRLQRMLLETGMENQN